MKILIWQEEDGEGFCYPVLGVPNEHFYMTGEFGMVFNDSHYKSSNLAHVEVEMPEDLLREGQNIIKAQKAFQEKLASHIESQKLSGKVKIVEMHNYHSAEEALDMLLSSLREK